MGWGEKAPTLVLKAIVELLATAWLVYAVRAFTAAGTGVTFGQPGSGLEYAGIIHVSWVAIIPFVYAWNISGAHLNPAVTVAHILRKDSPFKWNEGLYYIIAQFLGGFVGQLLWWWYNRTTGRLEFASFVRGNTEKDFYYDEGIAWELLAAFVLVLVTLVQTGPKTATSTLNVWNAVSIAGTYGIVFLFSSNWTGGSINPAYGTTYTLVDLFDTGEDDAIQFIWAYLLLPFVSAVAAWAAYQFVYLPAAEESDEEAVVKAH